MGLKRVFEILVGLAVLTAVVVYIIITSYDYNRLKPYITSAVYDATGRTLTLGGDIGIEVSFTPKLIVEDVSFQNAPWGTIPEMASVRRLEAQVALLPLIGGVVEVKRLILVEPEILIETDPSGKKGSNLEFTPPVKEEEKGPAAREAPASPDESGPTLPAIIFYDIRIERARLTYRDGPSGKSHAVGLDLLEAGTTGIESPVKFTIKGDYNDTGFELSGNTGPLTALVDPEKPLSIEVNVVALDTSLKLEGTVKDPLAIRGIEVSFDSRTGDIRKIGKALGKPLPLEGPLNVSGRLSDRGPKSYRISDLKMTLGPSDVSGSVDVNLSGEKPSVNIDLSSEKLDLRPLIAGGAGEARGAGGAGGVGGIGGIVKNAEAASPGQRLFPVAALPLAPAAALDYVDGVVKYSASRLILPQTTVEGFSTTMTLKNGTLMVRPLRAGIAGGKLDGAFNLMPVKKGARVSTEIAVKSLDVGRVQRELGAKEAFKGVIDIDVDLKTGGESVAAMMASLDGSTGLVMGKGLVENAYIDRVFSDLGASIFRLINPEADKEAYTTINCLVAEFEIKNGVASTRSFVIDTKHTSVIGGGKVDLGKERLGVSLRPYPKGGLGAARIGELDLSVSELARPLRLGGTFTDPSLELDPEGATEAVYKIFGVTRGVSMSDLIAEALSGKTPSDKNPCLYAIEVARKKAGQKKEAPKEKQPEMGEDVMEGLKGIGEELQKFFGK